MSNESKGSEEMKEKRSYRIIAIIALIVSIFCISIGYASYSTLLEIDAAGTISSNKWLIGFNNISNPILVNTAEETFNPIISSTSIKLNFSLPNDGDSISYTFDVINSGNIDAKLSSEPIFNIPTELKDSLNCTLTYADGTILSADDELNASQTKKLKIVITFVENGNNIINTSVNVSTTLLYVQK